MKLHICSIMYRWYLFEHVLSAYSEMSCYFSYSIVYNKRFKIINLVASRCFSYWNPTTYQHWTTNQNQSVLLDNFVCVLPIWKKKSCFQDEIIWLFVPWIKHVLYKKISMRTSYPKLCFDLHKYYITMVEGLSLDFRRKKIIAPKQESDAKIYNLLKQESHQKNTKKIDDA